MINNSFFVFCLLSFLGIYISVAQTNSIDTNIVLHDSIGELSVQQNIVFHNPTDKKLPKIYLHNWANSFKDTYTPLGDRLIEDYRKDFYYSERKERGFSQIHNLKVNNFSTAFNEKKNHPDIVEIPLLQSLNPKDSLVISLEYSIKIPDAKFTGYGKTKNGYQLRFWQIIPAVYHKKWQLMSNLDINDLLEDVANYNIKITLPKKYILESNLYQYLSKTDKYNKYQLIGHKKKDVILSIDTRKKFRSFKTKTQEIKTDAYSDNIPIETTNKIITKQIEFIEKYTGKHPHTEIFVDANTTNKNGIREVYGIPSWLKPFPKNFRWDVQFFKALCSKYINDILLHNKRTEYWFTDGLETFLMMEYLNKYYPKITLLGKYSNYWPIRHYNISKLTQKDKFAFVYQFSARRFYDQALTTTADSLSNFNRKIISKYKAGLGFKYLQDFIGAETFHKSIKQYLFNNTLTIHSPSKFLDILQDNTAKDLNWFREDYLKTSKKIDYKITSVKKSSHPDSLKVTIKNKRSFTAPVALYGINDKKVVFKKWIPNIDSVKTISLKKGAYRKLALNYENIYPEYNFLNNFRTTNNRLINKPPQFRLLKDIEDPYYNQIFYTPDAKYNLYDGLILGVRINNRPIIPHNFDFTITPNFGLKSRNLTGGFSLGYNHFLQKSTIYKIRYGLSASNFNYTRDLGYNTVTPYVSVSFRRKTLRDVGSKTFSTRLFYIDKEVAPGEPVTQKDRYEVLNFRYIYDKPDIIKRLLYAVNLEFGNNFTKFSTDVRYTKYFDYKKSFDLRLFGGMFLTNNSEGDYFNFGLNRSSDYLFEQNLFGRSESSGLFSQQFIISDAGFKSKYAIPQTANQLTFSINTSVSIWKWLEVYNDAAMLKNRGQTPRFFYENGFRLNFIPDIFEFYFPIYTNQGWEFNKPAYPSKVRFVITTNIDRIYNFIRRGLL